MYHTYTYIRQFSIYTMCGARCACPNYVQKLWTYLCHDVSLVMRLVLISPRLEQSGFTMECSCKEQHTPLPNDNQIARLYVQYCVALFQKFV